MATPAKYIWQNGQLVPHEKATVHVLTHALHYGSSVFEGIRAYNTPEGAQFFRLQEHMKRLFFSAKVYRIDIPFTLEESILNQKVIDAIYKSGKSGKRGKI